MRGIAKKNIESGSGLGVMIPATITISAIAFVAVAAFVALFIVGVTTSSHDSTGPSSDAVARVLEPLDGARPTDTEPFTIGFESLDQLAVVHRQFVGGQEAVPNTLGQKGFDIPGGGGDGHRMTLGGQPVPDGAQVSGVGAVHRDDQRFARGDHVVG